MQAFDTPVPDTTPASLHGLARAIDELRNLARITNNTATQAKNDASRSARIAQECFDHVLKIHQATLIPVRRRLVVTFSGAAAGGFVAMLALRAVAAIWH